MARNFYHVVCAGDDLPGLVATALLARKGHRCLVVGDPEAAAGPVECNGIRFEVPPLLLAALDSSPVIRWVFASLGVGQELRNRLVPCSPAYQMVTPTFRIDMGGRARGPVQELHREFGAAAAEADTWLSALASLGEAAATVLAPPVVLPAETFGERRALRARLRAAALPLEPDEPLPAFRAPPLDHSAHVCFDLPRRFAGQVDLPLGLAPSLAGLRLASILLDGVYSLEGGLGTLKGFLLDRIATYGGTVRLDRSISHMEVHWRAPLDLEVSHGVETCGCDVLLWNSDLGNAIHLLPEGRKAARLRETLSGVEPVAWRFTYHLVVAEEGLPECLARNVFLRLDPTAPPYGEGCMMVTVRGGGAERVLGLTCDVPADALKADPDYLEHLEERMLRTLTGHLTPFLDSHILAKATPRDPKDEHPPYGSPGLLPLYRPRDTMAWNPGLLPIRTPYRRVLLTSHQVLPELGLEGWFLTGISAATLAADVVRLKDFIQR